MKIKKALGVVGVVVLGALGSGLWELGTPLFARGWSWLLTLATLGLESLRDGLYAEAAGVIEPVGTRATAQAVGGLVMLTGIAILSYIRLSFPHKARPLAMGYLLILYASVFVILVASSRTVYVKQLVRYRATLEIMAAPHIPDTRLKQLRADYVQITGREGYLAHVETLRKIIEAEGIEAPVREFF